MPAKTTKKSTTKKSASKKAVVESGISFFENPSYVHALSYFPYGIGALAMFLLGKTEKKLAMHHIKYSALLAVGAFILFIILNGFFANIVNLAYLVISGFFAYKAFKGEEVKVEILDTIEGKISETVKK